MQKQRTWKQYRNIDLCMFALLLAVFEFIIVRASTWWFPDQLYTVSLAAAIASIVYMRWDYWGGIHAALAGLIFCFFSGGTRGQFIIYGGGNLLSLAAVPLLRLLGKEKVRTGLWGLIFPLVVLLLMQMGRMFMALALGAAPDGLIGFFTTDSLSFIFTFVIIWIARKLDGVYEDQKHYLLRINAREREKEVNYES